MRTAASYAKITSQGQQNPPPRVGTAPPTLGTRSHADAAARAVGDLHGPGRHYPGRPWNLDDADRAVRRRPVQDSRPCVYCGHPTPVGHRRCGWCGKDTHQPPGRAIGRSDGGRTAVVAMARGRHAKARLGRKPVKAPPGISATTLGTNAARGAGADPRPAPPDRRPCAP